MVDNNLNEEEQTQEELEPTPYQNTYRRNLEEPTFNEEEEQEFDDPLEATRQQLAQHEGLASSKKNGEQTHDFKKRYDDLKRHYDTKLNEWRQEKELINAKISVEAKNNLLESCPRLKKSCMSSKKSILMFTMSLKQSLLYKLMNVLKK